MLSGAYNRNFAWLHQPRWLFICGSVVAAGVALLAEGPGDYVGLVLLCICVGVISLWSLLGKPSLRWTVAIVCLLLLGWTVEEPESSLFQSILGCAQRLSQPTEKRLSLFGLEINEEHKSGINNRDSSR